MLMPKLNELPRNSVETPMIRGYLIWMGDENMDFELISGEMEKRIKAGTLP